jgi:maleylpyruvate isomerase
MDPRELDRDVAGAAGAHQRLLADLDAASPATDPAGPSLLPGWTVGHVLTHLARQADSVVRMLDGLPQYESAAVRNDQIEAGAARPFDQLVADVRRSIWALEARWAADVDWTATARTLVGEAPMSDLPFRRWRETDIHHVDLGPIDPATHYTFADLPPDYVRLELRRMEMLWTSRRPMGLTALPDAALAVPPHERLAWLMGRGSIEGLEPAGIF